MEMKKLLSLLLALALILALCACGAAGEESGKPSVDPTSAGEKAMFTDSSGRSVEVPSKITKIAVSGPLSQIVMLALAPDMLVGIATEWDPSAKLYLKQSHYDLPVLGQLYGGKGEMNLEELPDVIIDVGEPKDTVREDMDKLQEQTGIPFVHISAYTETMGDAYRTLGELLGLEEEAAVLAKYCDDTYAMALDVVSKVGQGNKTKVLYLLGDTGLNVIADGSYHSEIISLIADNAAVVDSPSSKGTGNESDMEQLMLWNPEVIIFANDSVYGTVSTDPTWQNLDAIKSGKYYEVPFGPYNWLGFPPSVQRYLGILWLADLLYPNLVEYDLYDAVTEYYALFYSCDLTQAQYDALMANSK